MREEWSEMGSGVYACSGPYSNADSNAREWARVSISSPSTAFPRTNALDMKLRALAGLFKL